jgi:hypothetical protein
MQKEVHYTKKRIDFVVGVLPYMSMVWTIDMYSEKKQASNVTVSNFSMLRFIDAYCGYCAYCFPNLPTYQVNADAESL